MDGDKQKPATKNLTSTTDPNVIGNRENSGSESSITHSETSPRIESVSSPNEPAYVLHVKPVEGKIIISISDDRVATSIGSKKQGDHVSAYRLYLEILCEVANCEDYTKIPERIANIAKAIMPDVDQKRVDDKLKEFEKKQALLLPRESRKDMTAFLGHLAGKDKSIKKIIAALDPDDEDDKQVIKAMLALPSIIDKKDLVKNTLKEGEMSVVVETIHELGQEFITALNNSPGMVFAKAAEGSEKKDATDGPNVQNGLYGLQAMNVLLSLKTGRISDTEYVDLLYDRLQESSSKLLRGLRQLGWNNDNRNEVLARTQMKSGGTVVQKAELKTNLDKTLEDHDKKIEEGKTINLHEKQAVFNVLLKTIDDRNNDKIAQRIGEFIGFLFDFPYKDDRTSDLLEIFAARHLVIIFNAFPMLQTLDQNMQNKIIDNFIDNKILKDQKWEDYKLENEQGTKSNLTRQDIRVGINNNAALGDNGRYGMKQKDSSQQANRTLI